MNKLIVLLIYVTFLFAGTSNADNNQTKELSEEDKKWLEEYMKLETELEKSKKLGKTLDELTNMVELKK